MTLSDDLTKLAARAKQAEDLVAAAKTEARAQLQHEVQHAAGLVEQSAEQLRHTAETNEGKIADWWQGVQKSWEDQIVSIRRDIEAKRAKHDLKAAQRDAELAEQDAEFAIKYAYWAIEDAEYAALDATLRADEHRQPRGVALLRLVRDAGADTVEATVTGGVGISPVSHCCPSTGHSRRWWRSSAWRWWPAARCTW